MRSGSRVRGGNARRGIPTAYRAVIGALLAGLLLGGGIGALVGATRPVSYSSATSISVLPDSSVLPTVSGGAATAPAQDSTAFIQSQLVVINGAPLRTQVRDLLLLGSDPQLSATQIGQTYVVQLVATASTRALALSEARAAATSYAMARTASLTTGLNAAIKIVQAQVRTARINIAADPVSGTSPGTADPLNTQLSNLLIVNSQLVLALGQVNTAVQTVTPPSIESAGTLTTTQKGTVAGGVLGAIVVLLALLAWRRAAPKVRVAPDLAALDLPVLLPTLPRRRRSEPPWQPGAGRLLASRVDRTDPDTGQHAPLVVVGATPGVGTSDVVRVLAANLAERSPVLLVLASGDPDRPPALVPGTGPVRFVAPDVAPTASDGVCLLRLEGVGPDRVRRLRALVRDGLFERSVEQGWAVIVDAPAVSESDLALDLAHAAGGATLVAGSGVSRPLDLLAAVDLFDARGVTLLGVVLNEVPRRRSPPPHRTADPAPVQEPVQDPVLAAVHDENAVTSRRDPVPESAASSWAKEEARRGQPAHPVRAVPARHHAPPEPPAAELISLAGDVVVPDEPEGEVEPTPVTPPRRTRRSRRQAKQPPAADQIAASPGQSG